jgi:hypothetical protein
MHAAWIRTVDETEATGHGEAYDDAFVAQHGSLSLLSPGVLDAQSRAAGISP